MPSASLTADRVLVTAAVVATCVLFVPNAADPVNVVKLVGLLLAVLALGVLAVARVAKDRLLVLPVGALAGAALALLGALVVATVAAPDTWTAVWGTSGRNSGLLAYGSAVLLLLATLRLFDAPSTRVLVAGLVVAGSFTATYGLLQYVGVDAVGWNNPFSPIIAALGNPNFAAAYLGIALPAAGYGALHRGWPGWVRALCGLVAVLSLLVAVLSESVQGPLAGGAGLVVLLLAWVLDRPAPQRRAGLAVTAVLGALGVAVLAAGLAGLGPANAFFAGISYRARTWYWDAALTMFGREPLFGVGLDSYGTTWWLDRPLASVRELGGDHFSDAAHSVPLQMLAQGGLVLGLAYLAVVVVTGVALGRGLARTSGDQRLLLGSLGGSWTAYQVQSLVSIDQVPLLVVHLVLAGAVVVAAGRARTRVVRLPGAVPPPSDAPDRGRRRALPTQRERSGADHALVTVAALVALVLAYQALDPLRASQAAYDGDVALARGDGDAALAAYQQAVDLDAGNAAWRSRVGTLFNAAEQPEPALEAFVEAAEVNPYDIAALRTAGRLAAPQGQLEAAEDYFERAVALDPLNSATVLDLARFWLEHDDAEAALDLLERTAPALPDDAALQAALGDARRATGDAEGARAAYEQALATEPEQPVALEGLRQLGAA